MDRETPRVLKVDTVAHCGTSMAGMFVYSLNAVDIGSGWVEARALERSVIDQALPFRLREIDSDNGSEFLNHRIDKYLRSRKRTVRQTRSRDYKKNDNTHIGQKNWTHIRQLPCYERFHNPVSLS